MRSITLLLVLSTFLSKAQTLLVVDHEEQPMSNVEVFSGDVLLGQTDSIGRFAIGGCKPGSYLHVQHTGYYGQWFRCPKADDMVRLTLFPRVDQIQPVFFILGRETRGRNDIALSVSKLERRDIELYQSPTAADALGLGGQVYIQKSQAGGGSPMIRGFATNRILLVVDDVRMNTAIFREGNVQNVIAVDPHVVGNTDIIFGPGSLFYGSDAIGGVVSFNTLPIELPHSGTSIKGRANYRYGSAQNEQNTHIDISVATARFGSFSSISLQQFGDLRMGSKGSDAYLRPSYVRSSASNGSLQDSLYTNPDPNVQLGSAYRQFNFSQRFLYQPGKTYTWDYIMHASFNPEVGRYDKLIEPSLDGLKYAEWHYGPQNWVMNRLQLSYVGDKKLVDHAKLTLANQWFTESRVDRRFNKPIRQDRTEEVLANSINLDLTKQYKKFRFHYGAEWVLNDVYSNGLATNLDNGSQYAISSRYPDGSSWMSSGVYVNAYKRLLPWYRIEVGLRHSAYVLQGTVDTSLFNIPVNDIGSTNTALTYSISQKWSLADLQIGLISSSAYRSPNIDDVGKIFDPNPGTVVVPNPSLDPELAYTQELNLDYKLGGLSVMASCYYTYLDQAINKVNVGTDSLLYDGELSQVQQLANIDHAQVRGIQLQLAYMLDSNWSLASSYTLNRGETSTEDPLRHITPDFGRTNLRFTNDRWVVDLFLVYQQRFDADRFPLSERGDTYLYALDNDLQPYSPAWVTWNIRMSFRLHRQFTLNGGLENLADIRYRPYGSGISAPGRNLSIAANFRF